MNFNTKKLLIVCIVLVAFIYLRFYTSVAKDLKIMQLSLQELTPSILMSRNPLIIEEQIVNPMSLLGTVFRYLYVYKRIDTGAKKSHNTHVFKQNKARFLILSSKKDNCSIEISNPRMVKNKGDEPFHVELRLHLNMCAILPYNWHYRIKEPESVLSIELEDIVSLTIGKYF